MKVKASIAEMIPYKAGQTRPRALKLSSNENPLGACPRGVESIKRNAPLVSLYPEGTSAELREKLAKKHNLTAEHFLIGNGSDELLSLAAAAYLEPGHRGLTAQSTFSEYRYSIRLWGGKYEAHPLKEGRFPLEDLARAAAPSPEIPAGGAAPAGIIYLCNPNNPTGTYFSAEELRSFLDRISPEIPVILDEAYADYAEAPDYPDGPALLADYPNLLVTRTFSKIYGLAALRVGYMVSSPENIAALSRAKQPFNVNLLAQRAAAAALDDRYFVERSRKITREARELLYEELKKDGIFFYPTQANFLCLNAEVPAQELFEAMLKEGLAIRPLGSFGMDTWIRVTLGTRDQMRLFLKLFRLCRRRLLEERD